MTDFLANLIARHTDTAPQIMPRLPSIFEPVGAEVGSNASSVYHEAATGEADGSVFERVWLSVRSDENAPMPEQPMMQRSPPQVTHPAAVSTMVEPSQPIAVPMEESPQWKHSPRLTINDGPMRTPAVAEPGKPIATPALEWPQENRSSEPTASDDSTRPPAAAEKGEPITLPSAERPNEKRSPKVTAGKRLDPLARSKSVDEETRVPLSQLVSGQEREPQEAHARIRQRVGSARTLGTGEQEVKIQASQVPPAKDQSGKAPSLKAEVMRVNEVPKAVSAQPATQPNSDFRPAGHIDPLRQDVPTQHTLGNPNIAPEIRPLLKPVAPVIGPPNSSAVRLGDSVPQPKPTINVTIGRIEVRATMSPPQNAPKPQSRNMTMSLDEYLRRRSGGSDR